jgi:hypothetical protein
MICPTCENNKENHCCSCGTEIAAEEQALERNPFAYEIHSNDDLHLECDGCRYEAAMDI